MVACRRCQAGSQRQSHRCCANGRLLALRSNTMSRKLPALRRGFDIVASPKTSRPGLLLRDPLRYAEKVLRCDDRTKHPLLERLGVGGTPRQPRSWTKLLRRMEELAKSQAEQLFWLLGIDLAHVGRRYGDDFAARANQGAMAEVAEQDQQRLESLCSGEIDKFFELVKINRDELKWCGYSPLTPLRKHFPRRADGS
jgi:hypothetical protein